MKAESVGEKAKLERELSRSLMNVIAVVEGYCSERRTHHRSGLAQGVRPCADPGVKGVVLKNTRYFIPGIILTLLTLFGIIGLSPEMEDAFFMDL